MSARCSYSSKYKPLVLAKRRQITNDDAFQEWVKNTFTNPDVAMGLALASEEPTNNANVVQRRLNQAPQKIDSIKSFFVNNSVEYNKCIRNFTTSVVEAALYNRNTNKWIDADGKNGNTTNLNVNLFEAKKDLINQILPAIGKSKFTGSISDENIDDALTEAIYDALEGIDSYTGEIAPSVYSAYVILKNFNHLIAEKAPFIKLKPQYENSLQHGVNMYDYQGPSVKHRVSWTTNEHVSAQDQYSDLAKILLDYLPEYNSNGPIPDSTIGVDGFTSIMNRFKTALLYSDEMQKHRNAYFDGKLNILDALNTYLDVLLRTNKITRQHNQDTMTLQLNKLRGIIELFKSGLSTDVKEMFEGMFYKTVPLSYLTYAYRNGKFGRFNLKDSFVNTQMLNLQDTINGAVLTLRSNQTRFDKIKKNWGITVDTRNRRIEINAPDGSIHTTITYDQKVGDYKSFSTSASTQYVSANDLGKLIYDLLGVYIPADGYDEVAAMLREDGNLFNDFKDLIAITLLGATKNSGFIPTNESRNKINWRQLFLYENTRNAAETLSLIYGTETRNVVNNVNGDALPTNGLTSMIQNSAKLGAEMAENEDSWDTGYNALARNSLLAPRKNLQGDYSKPGFLPPMVRQGVRIGNKTKSVSQLTLSELMEIAMYDFLDPLHSKDGTIYLQNENFADKERHWVVPFLLQEYYISVPGIAGGKPGMVNKKINMRDALYNIAFKGESSNDVIELWRQSRQKRYNDFQSNLCLDFNEAFKRKPNERFTTLRQIDDFLATEKLSVAEVSAIFQLDRAALKHLGWDDSRIGTMLEGRSRKVDCLDETTVTETGKIARVNEVALHYVETFNSQEKATLRLKKSRAFFAKDLFKSRTKLNKHQNTAIYTAWKDIPSNWKETRGGIETGNAILFKVFDGSKEIKIDASNSHLITDSRYSVVLNPILEAYLLSDIIYSNEFNFLNTGDVFGHPSKNKNGSIDDNGFGSSAYYDSSEASRLVAKNKRNVIYGGAIHAFNTNLANNRGTAKRIKIAVIDDPGAPVWTLMGGLKSNKSNEIDDSQDVFDGAGFQSIYQALLEQESLKDAAAGVDEKTILGWQHKYYGTQMLLKWAVYALTNERRRISRNSAIKAELLFKKMHNIEFSKELDFVKIWSKYVTSDMYFKDYETRKHYKILGVEKITLDTGEVVYARVVQECTESGNLIDGTRSYLNKFNKLTNDIVPADFKYNTIYDLDQFFGGCDEESLVEGRLVYSDKGNHIVTDIICDYDLKQYFTSYLVNKSAMKSGAANINDTSRYYNDEAFNTMEMSTEYGGLQMNAEHELDDSEVTEMTQMISALMEKGWSLSLVNRIYQDIGDVVLESLKTFKNAINSTNDSAKLKEIFGRALIESYAKGDRDTLGLAQSFLAKAERLLRENNIDFKFPFSGATINGSFVSTVSSLLTKKGIRRKYAGVAAVLTPAYDMIQVHAGGYTSDTYADYLYDWKNRPENLYKNTSVASLINDMYVINDLGEQVLNPFIEERPDKRFTFEDTIVIDSLVLNPDGTYAIDESTGRPLVQLKEVRIDSAEKYEHYRNEYKGNIRVWKSKPRNLRCATAEFTWGTNTFNIHDLTSVRAANRSAKKTWSETDSAIIFGALGHGIQHFGDDVIAYKDEVFVGTDLSGLIATKDRTNLQKVIDIRRTLYNIVQYQLAELQDNSILNDVLITKGENHIIRNLEVQAAEIVLGKMYAKQFGLRAGDDLGKIMSEGEDFFYRRLINKYNLPNVNPELYDAVLYTKSEEQILVKFDENLQYNFTKTANPNITKVNGKAYLNDNELFSVDGKEFYQISDGAQLYNVVVINDFNRFSELINAQYISQYRINYNGNIDNAVDLAFTVNDSYRIEGQTFTLDNLILRPIEEQARLLKIAEDEAFDKRLEAHAQNMFESFKLSLNFVGTRIPAQAMQSFQPMKVVAFTDSETNDVYVNRHNMYLEGSDLKQYWGH